MGDKLLARTSFLVCLVVVIGFALTAFLGHRANYSAFMDDIENVSLLASEDISYQQRAFFARPLSVSEAMAVDHFLVAALEREAAVPDDAAQVAELATYLDSYRSAFDFDSVFLVSAATQRYLTPAGVDRVLAKDDPENDWFFSFLSGNDEHNLVVDNDQVLGAGNEATVFVNCKVRAADGRVLGVVGVGFRAGELQRTLGQYREQFGVEASLVSPDGTLVASPDHNGYEHTCFFDARTYDDATRADILAPVGNNEARSFWADEGEHTTFVVVRDVSGLDWRLVVERDSSEVVALMRARTLESVAIIVGIILAILIIIMLSIRSFRKRIVELTRSLDEERRTMAERAVNELFEDVYDLDITHDRPADERSAHYFEGFGSPPGTPFSESLRVVAESQIKEEYRQKYIDTFSPEHVLAAYHEGTDTLRCELEISDGAGGWYWMRITGLIVKSGDGTVHLLSYRQNIEGEKLQENLLIARMDTDEMTGLLTKTATQRHIEEVLARAKEDEPRPLYALFVLDIDRFKDANDVHGHLFGDKVLMTFAEGLRQHFGSEGVVGRVGGDEFVAFVRVPSESWAARKAEVLVRSFDRMVDEGTSSWKMTSSIGVAVAPRDGEDFETLFSRADEALYEAKRRGRNGFKVYGE